MTTKAFKILALIAATAIGASSVPAPQYSPEEIKYSASDGSFHAVVNGADQRTGGAQSGNAARKVDAANSIEYAASGGSDSNNGKSWDTAKATVMAAYDALPAAGGSIYICGNETNQVLATSTGQGIWIMGPADPHYASPPTGWRKAKAVSFIGACGNSGDQQGSAPAVFIGGVSSYNSPAIWLSSMQGSQANLHFENFNLRYFSTAVRIGFDSNNTESNTSGVYGASFENIVTKMCNGTCGPTAGPGWYIGGGDSADLFFDHIVAQGNAQATPGADNQAAILIKAGSSISGFIIKITNSVMETGQIKYYEPQGGSVITVHDTYSEGLVGGGTFWAASAGSGSVTAYDIENVFTADGTACGAKFDVFAWHLGVLSTKNTQVCGNAIQQGSVVGHNLTNMTGFPGDPLTQGLNGISYGRFYSFLGNTQRQFSPSMVRYQNLAPSTASSWTLSGTGASIATGIPAPDGTTGAARVTTTTNTGTITFYSQSLSIAVGQYFIAGLFQRFNTADDYYDFSGSGAFGLGMSIGGSRNTVSCSSLWPPGIKTDGWFWVYQICRVTAAPTSPATVSVTSTAPVVRAHASVMDFYAPMLLNIPAGSISNDEVYELANNLVPYANTCMVGTLCGILGSSGGVAPPRISSGFGTGASVTANNGTSAFRINVGSSNTGNGVIGLPAASRGWNCFANDITTTSTAVSQTKQTASTKITATLQNYTDTSGTGAWVDRDVLAVSCFAY